MMSTLMHVAKGYAEVHREGEFIGTVSRRKYEVGELWFYFADEEFPRAFHGPFTTRKSAVTALMAAATKQAWP